MYFVCYLNAALIVLKKLGKASFMATPTRHKLEAAKKCVLQRFASSKTLCSEK